MRSEIKSLHFWCTDMLLTWRPCTSNPPPWGVPRASGCRSTAPRPPQRAARRPRGWNWNWPELKRWEKNGWKFVGWSFLFHVFLCSNGLLKVFFNCFLCFNMFFVELGIWTWCSLICCWCFECFCSWIDVPWFCCCSTVYFLCLCVCVCFTVCFFNGWSVYLVLIGLYVFWWGGTSWGWTFLRKVLRCERHLEQKRTPSFWMSFFGWNNFHNSTRLEAQNCASTLCTDPGPFWGALLEPVPCWRDTTQTLPPSIEKIALTVLTVLTSEIAQNKKKNAGSSWSKKWVMESGTLSNWIHFTLHIHKTPTSVKGMSPKSNSLLKCKILFGG